VCFLLHIDSLSLIIKTNIMKKLELNQMGYLVAGKYPYANGTGTGVACGLTAIAVTGILTAATFGAGLFAGAMISGLVCGGAIGWGSASGSWI
jgi:hypothetical protein